MILLRAFSAGMMMAIVAAPIAATGQQFPSQQAPQQQAPPPRQPAPRQQQPAPQPQQPAQQQPAPQQQQPNVVATVNGDPITEREVHVNLQSKIQGQQVDPQVAQQLRQQVLDGLIEGRLVEQYAMKSGADVEQKEVTTVLKQFENQLAGQQVSLDDYLKSIGHTRESFKDRVKGSLAWQKYQREQVTPDKLNEYFEENEQAFNAGSLQEAEQEVRNAYVNEMWGEIISEMKPTAEINVRNAQRPARQPEPRRLPQR